MYFIDHMNFPTQIASFARLLSPVFLKFTLIRGVDTKICLGFLLGKECPDSKNSGVLKTAKSGNFETVNYIYPNLTIFGVL